MLTAIRHLIRLAGILRTLARHDALFLAHPLPFAGAVARRVSRKGVPGRPGERLARALVELGPTFIKLGQTLSTRADLFGAEMAEDLSKLQDQLPPFPGDQARAIVVQELGGPIEDFFLSFDDEAVAAASIAQVHFAVTTDGREVAVKVLRPDITFAFERDIAFFRWGAELGERLVPAVRRLRPVEVVDTFAHWVRIELDLRMEAAAADELRENFRDEPGYRVPQVDWERTRRRVLTAERVGGLAIDEPEALRAAGHDPERLLAHSAEIFFIQVFRDGFFHADLHAGNVFVEPDGGLVVVDFGIMGRLDRRSREYLADMLQALLARDYRGVAEVHFRAGFVPAHHDRALFAQACRAIAEPIFGKPLEEISLGRLLAQLFQVTAQFDMAVQPHLLLLQKTLLMAEGMGHRICPGINMWVLAEPMVAEWLVANRGPTARIEQAMIEASAAAGRAGEIVDIAQRALERIAAGELVQVKPPSVMARLWPLWFAGMLLALGALWFG